MRSRVRVRSRLRVKEVVEAVYASRADRIVLGVRPTHLVRVRVRLGLGLGLGSGLGLGLG